MTNSYKLAERINSDVNARVTYKSDLEQFDTPEFWAVAGKFGDCEDYALSVTAANMFRSCVNFAIVPPFNLSSCTNATNMFFNCTLTTQSYSDFLINLATLSLKSGVSFHGGNSKYNTAGGVARAYIISNFGWTITDGGAA